MPVFSKKYLARNATIPVDILLALCDPDNSKVLSDRLSELQAREDAAVIREQAALISEAKAEARIRAARSCRERATATH